MMGKTLGWPFKGTTKRRALAEVWYRLKVPFYRLATVLRVGGWISARRAAKISLPKRLPQSLTNGTLEIGDKLLDGYFQFDGELHQFDARSWKFKQASAKWHEHLHGFRWLYDLRALNTEESRQAASAMVLDWCDRHSAFSSVAWSTNATVDRIGVWLSLFEFITPKLEPAQRRRVMRALYRQAAHLAQAFPLDAVGVDRIRVSATLIAVDLAFYDEIEHDFKGWQLLERGLRKEMLADGGIRERSTERSLVLLQTLIELRATLLHFEKTVPRTLNVAIGMLAKVLEALRLPDGSLAKFHLMPSQAQISVLERMLQFSDGSVDRFSFPDLGLERLVAKRSVLLFDTGKFQTTLSNRSVHASPLAFEFALGKQKIITNCGSHSDQAKFGLAQRATAAHSTIVVNDTNALPVLPLQARNTLNRYTLENGWQKGGQQGNGVIRQDDERHKSVQAQHELYAPQGIGLIQRHLQLSGDGELLTGSDLIKRASSTADVRIRFHLHPDVKPRLNESWVSLRLPTGRSWRLDCIAGATLSLEDSFYLDQGRVRPCKQVVLSVNWRGQSEESQFVGGNGGDRPSFQARVDWRLGREGRAARQTL